MSSRPQIPSLLTSAPRDVNGNRSFSNRPHATPTTHSPALSDSMSSRPSKRPLDNLSRGESPPDKRSRLPDSRSALQDRYTNTAVSRIPSPPPSRKSSFAGLSNVPTGPRLASDHRRPESAAYQRRQDVRVLSPSSLGSGASTPTHCAPPAPSMLPTTESGLPPQQDVPSAATNNTPFTMQSLRRLKDRKRAIAQQTTVSVSASVDVKLKTQALDIAHLKKERDDIKKELNEIKQARVEERDDMVRRLVEVEANSTRIDEIANAAVAPLVERLNLLERSAADLPDLRQGLHDLSAVPARLATVENRPTTHQPKPELGGSDTLGNLQLKPLTDRLDGLETASSQYTADLLELKTAKELQKIDINSLKTWKDAQRKAISEEAVKKLIADETKAKAAVLSKSLSSKIDDGNSRLSERITSNQASILDLQAFKGKLEPEIQKHSAQLAALDEKVKDVDRNDVKADRAEKRLDEFRDRMDKRRDEMHELSEKVDKEKEKIKAGLKALRKEFEYHVRENDATVSQAELGRLPSRLRELEQAVPSELRTSLDDLEKAARAPRFKKVGTTDASSSTTPLNPPTSNTDTRLELVEGSLQRLRKVVEGSSGLTTKVTALSDRQDNMEANNASARPLDSVEQMVEMAMDQTLGKTTAKTVEKAAEKRVKTLIASERKAVDRSIEEVNARLTAEIQDLRKWTETRLTEGIQAVHNRIRESAVSGSSAVAATAPQAQSEVGGLDIVRAEVDSLRGQLETAEQTLHDHGGQLEVVMETVPCLFNERFDPLKATIEEQLGKTTATLEAHGRDLTALTQQVSNSPSQQNAFGQQQQAQLHTVTTEVTCLKTALAILESSVSTKADSDTMRNQLDAVNFGMNHLQSRYDNINTDGLYQRMVGWFVETYPGLPKLQEDIDYLLAWVNARSDLLDRLTQDATQLRSLVNIAPHLQELATINPQLKHLVANTTQLAALIQAHNEMPQTLARIDQASSDAKVAKSKAEQACSDTKAANAKADQTEQRLNEQQETLATINGSVSGLQTSFRNLNSATSPFVRAEAVEALRETVKALQDQLGEQLRTAMDADAEAKMKKSIEDMKQTVHVDMATFAKAQALRDMERILQTLQSQISDLQAEKSDSIQSLRSEFDTDRSKRDTAHRNVQKTITELAQTVKSDRSVLAKTAELESLKRTMLSNVSQEQKARLETEKARLETEESLRSAIETDSAKVLDLERNAKDFSHELKRVTSDYETTTRDIWDQLSDLSTTTAQLRNDLDTMVQKYIEPNRDFFGLIGIALVVISQLQQVVESMNQNLPVAPLKLEWDYYLPTHGQSKPNGEPSNSKGKGKSKQ